MHINQTQWLSRIFNLLLSCCIAFGTQILDAASKNEDNTVPHPTEITNTTNSEANEESPRSKNWFQKHFVSILVVSALVATSIPFWVDLSPDLGIQIKEPIPEEISPVRPDPDREINDLLLTNSYRRNSFRPLNKFRLGEENANVDQIIGSHLQKIEKFTQDYEMFANQARKDVQKTQELTSVALQRENLHPDTVKMLQELLNQLDQPAMENHITEQLQTLTKYKADVENAYQKYQEFNQRNPEVSRGIEVALIMESLSESSVLYPNDWAENLFSFSSMVSDIYVKASLYEQVDLSDKINIERGFAHHHRYDIDGLSIHSLNVSLLSKNGFLQSVLHMDYGLRLIGRNFTTNELELSERTLLALDNLNHFEKPLTVRIIPDKFLGRERSNSFDPKTNTLYFTGASKGKRPSCYQCFFPSYTDILYGRFDPRLIIWGLNLLGTESEKQSFAPHFPSMGMERFYSKLTGSFNSTDTAQDVLNQENDSSLEIPSETPALNSFPLHSKVL